MSINADPAATVAMNGPGVSSTAYARHVREQIEMHRHLAGVYASKRHASAYSLQYHRHWNARICRIARLDRGALVLDLGCGTGILFSDLAARGYRVVGLDVSPDMLLASRNRVPEVARLCADGGRIPVDDSTFDAVVCRGSIHHMPDAQTTLREIARVLKRGGRLIFSEPSNDFILNRAARRLMYAVNREFHRQDEAFRRNRIIPLLEDVGLEIEYSRGFGFLAYVFAGFPDKLGILGKMPGNGAITRCLIAVDTLLEALPYINRLALHWQVRARKK